MIKKSGIERILAALVVVLITLAPVFGFAGSGGIGSSVNFGSGMFIAFGSGASSLEILSESGTEDVSQDFIDNTALISGLSPDGAAVVGGLQDGSGDEHAMVWTQADGMTDIGPLGTPDMRGRAWDMSSDGTVIVGEAGPESGNLHAFRWESGTMTDIGTLGGDYSVGRAVSSDGQTVVGSSSTSGGEEHAFRWTVSGGSMEDLGTLGGTRSVALDVSGDGSVVVGGSYLAGDASVRAFRWEDGGSMTDIGTLGGDSVAVAVSSDGTIIAGNSQLAPGGILRGFRWVEGGSMTDIGTLGGDGTEVYGMSADGNVIVGTSNTSGGAMTAFYWDNGTMKSLADAATESGVDVSGADLVYAWKISDDGKTVLASADYGATMPVYIVKLGGGSGGGIITEEELVQSLASSRVVAQQGVSSVGQGIGYSMFTAQRALSFFAAPRMASAGVTGMSAGAPYTMPSRVSAYATGSFGLGQNGDSGNTAVNGSAGLLFRVSDSWAVGAGVIGGTSNVDTQLGGSSDLQSIGGSLIASYAAGDTGFKLYGTAAMAYLDSDSDRHYMNGLSVDASHGETHGIGYGGAVHAGYALAVLDDKTTVEPYGELEYSKISMDGYAEQGGAFAAAYSDHDMHRLVSRLGAAVDHRFGDDLKLGFRAAWGHRLNGDGGAFTALSSGFTLPLAGNVGDRDWAEFGMAGSYKLTPASTLGFDLSARTGKIEESRYQATIGLSYAF